MSMRAVSIISMIFFVVACDTSRNTVSSDEKYFLRYYGAAGYQEAVDMVLTDDNNYLLLGNSRVSLDAPSQVYLVKVNQSGHVLNEKFFTSANSQIAKDIEATTDGDYLILIDSITSSGSNIMLKVVDDEGTVSATAAYSLPGNYNEFGNTVTQLTDSGTPAGFIVTGYTDALEDATNAVSFDKTTALKVRFNQDGTPYTGFWKNYDGVEGDDIGIRIIQRGDLNDETKEPFVFFGYSDSNIAGGNTSFNFWISEVDSKGEGVGSGIVENSPTNQEKLSGVVSINQTVSSSFILTGTVTDGAGDDKIFIAGVNPSLTADTFLGSQALNIELGNLKSLNASYQSVSVTPLRHSETGYLIAANQVLVDDTDIILTKLSVSGAQVWTEPVRFGGGGNDRQSVVMELADGRILLFGTMELGNDRQSKMTLMKLNKRGQLRE